MNQFLFFTTFSPLIDLFIITSFLLAREAIGIDSQFLACDPKTCGDAQIITFPFYIQDEQESFCGYPGFNVSCQNGHPILRLQDNDYIIRNISYETQTLRLSNFAVYDTRTTCTPPFRNASIPSDRFNIYPNQTELFLFYHCNSSQIDGNSELIKYKVNCSSDNASNSTLLISKDDPLLDNASSVCENVVETAVDVQRGGERINEIEGMLERGFVLNWVSSNCSLCQGSGGTCGFDNNTYHFRCFCRDRPHASLCNSDNSGSSVIIIAPIATAAGIGILIITVCYLRRRNIIFFWKKKTQDCKSIEAFLRSHGPLALKRYRYSEVKKMTGTFKIKLGQGGYGSVFKGELPDGCLVAVKVLKESKSNGEEFINEVASISRTSHINIVTLLGFCFEGSKRALVYEFIANGSLEKYICEENALNSNHLGWETLFDIAVGIARGLEYLHRGCNTRILHFDIKPHNILLDENFCPKISDFGLAKVCTKRESIISMKDARGTIGYIAPEVFLRNIGGVSHKSDVYSYGMLVLEMVGGRKNISVETDNTSEVYFPDWIYRCLEVGKELGLGRINIEEEKQIARKMVLVSLWCIQTDPSNRPPMSRVVEMLHGSVTSLPIPPKPYLFSPPHLQSMADFSTTIVTS